MASDQTQEAEMEAQLKAAATQRREFEIEVERLQSKQDAQQGAERRLNAIPFLLARLKERVENSTYQDWRKAVAMLGVQVKVWPNGHIPRIEVEMDVPQVLADEMSPDNLIVFSSARRTGIN